MPKAILSLLLLTSLAMASCKDNDTELRSALGEQLTLSVGVNSSTASRAMVIGTQLPEGSSIGVRVTDGGANYQGTDYSHVRFTSAGSGEAQKWTAEPPVYLSGQAATIYAYSPYQSTEGFEMTAIPVDMTEADQTDWLYATPLTGPCDSDPKADITFNHALTAFTLSFHKEGYPGVGEVTAVKIQSPALATGGTLDATAGEFTEVTGQGDALTRTATFTLGDAVTSASTVQVMVVPTALKAALNITVTVDGKVYTAATSSMNFIAGHNYALTMKLTAKDLGLSQVEIIDWQNVDLGEDEFEPIVANQTNIYAVREGDEALIHPDDIDTDKEDYIGVAIHVTGKDFEQKFMIRNTIFTGCYDVPDPDAPWYDTFHYLYIKQYETCDGVNDYGYLYGKNTPQLTNDYTAWKEGALSDFDGKKNTEFIKEYGYNSFGTLRALSYKSDEGEENYWYVPGVGQLALVCLNKTALNDVYNKIGSSFKISGDMFWSSTDDTGRSTAWYINFSNGKIEINVKHEEYNVLMIHDIE